MREEYWEDLLPEDQERELTKLEEEKIGYEFAQRANILHAMFKYREIIRKGKTASDLSSILKIPLSSVYKKLSDLENLTLVEIEKTVLSEKGRRFKIYRSRINRAEISIKKPDPTLILSAN